MKHSRVSSSLVESEVQALAATEKLADFVKTLRESLCLPTKTVEIRCDSTAAITSATGEGSWKTKSAANQVYGIRQQVVFGTLKVTYDSTLEQCADSLTKFLKGGPEQRRAREHLSLQNVRQRQPGGKIQAVAACSVENRRESSADSLGFRVCRVSVSDSCRGSVPEEFRTAFGSFPCVRRKK